MMRHQNDYSQILNHLKSALAMLELGIESKLRKEIFSVCDFLEKENFRIAVFAPFNYGKSTLLNALLGQRTLPIDLIPTTGAAIYIRYGEKLHSRITLIDGTIISEDGTDILKQYAILDDQRYMRNDVASVEVYCSHPFLQIGTEFLDLPGTNDREEQDNLVRDRLLTSDLIVQVLDARKLMTLEEREHLRDWLLERGIETVVFVVNFLNLLEPEEQKEVYYRLRFVAESFRSQLPPGVSNLYRVDALPALRARLQGDTSAVQTTGLTIFESALQTIVAAHREKLAISLPRLRAIIKQVQEAGEQKKQAIVLEIQAEKQKQASKLAIQQKANRLLQQGFQKSVSELEAWLYLPNLVARYQTEIALSLQQENFEEWLSANLQSVMANYQQTIVEWVRQSCEIFEEAYPGDLVIAWPATPKISFAEPPSTTKKSQQSLDGDVVSVAIPTGLGWVLGGPLGAAVLGGTSYILNKLSAENPSQSEVIVNASDRSGLHLYEKAAADYLTSFSQQAISTLQQYQEKAKSALRFQGGKQGLENENTSSHYQLQLLTTVLENLTQELEHLKTRSSGVQEFRNFGLWTK